MANALSDLETNTQDLKASLRPLQFVSAREVRDIYTFPFFSFPGLEIWNWRWFFDEWGYGIWNLRGVVCDGDSGREQHQMEPGFRKGIDVAYGSIWDIY